MIDTMSPMRKLSEQHKIPGRSLPEIVSRYDGLISRQQTIVGRKFNNRKVPAEVVTNAIVLHFLDLPEPEQDEILGRYLPEMATLMADAQDPAPEEAAPAHFHAQGRPAGESPRLKKKRTNGAS